MTITIQVPSVLWSCCDGASQLSIVASTVRDALEQIQRSHPELYGSVCDETGAVRQHVNLFVNSTLVRNEDELNKTLAPGDVIMIFQAVSGG